MCGMAALGETGHGPRRPILRTIFIAKNITKIGTWNMWPLDVGHVNGCSIGVSKVRWTENAWAYINKENKLFYTLDKKGDMSAESDLF